MASFDLTTQNGFNAAKDFLLSNKNGILGFVSNAFFCCKSSYCFD